MAKRFPTYDDDITKVPDLTPSGWPRAALKDHDISVLKNELRDVAIRLHATEQLRSRLGTVLGRYIN